MTLKELLEEKSKKEKEIKEINEQIQKYQHLNAIACYGTLIKTFEELENLLPYETLDIEIYCEECEKDIDAQIEFKDIIDTLKYEKDKLERRINNE